MGNTNVFIFVVFYFSEFKYLSIKLKPKINPFLNYYKFKYKINISVKAAPTRKAIPPKGNITFQMNPNIGIQGSCDKNGNWQSQLQLYFRY